ncbi:hypothetical protein [Burkholderia vietnamiensis]|jgi:hypothetical protein|uniref:hypothetical protein n=1 Tax=Burkholderia vietnamiensis TaxID=60552 RepID=UPI0012D9CEB7|nr:hypothetical protein [Burkholderia vietnamiensis]MDN7926080.1 hypothetical protein [Burkholderia vietnamiensis]HDR9251542.1 hypothetical protein [Burkholderia vietnamiensis]
MGKEHSFLRHASARLWVFDEADDEIGTASGAARTRAAHCADFVIPLRDTAQA